MAYFNPDFSTRRWISATSLETEAEPVPIYETPIKLDFETDSRFLSDAHAHVAIHIYSSFRSVSCIHRVEEV